MVLVYILVFGAFLFLCLVCHFYLEIKGAVSLGWLVIEGVPGPAPGPAVLCVWSLPGQQGALFWPPW